MTPGEARGYLARFLFRGEDVFKEVRLLSGGERSRLELALLGVMPSNVYLLDEPTNHLDVVAREAIEAFLLETPATMLVVSHDRRFLDTVCERLWVVDGGAVAPFDGGYRAWRAAVADGWTVAGAMEQEARRLRPATRARRSRGARSGPRRRRAGGDRRPRRAAAAAAGLRAGPRRRDGARGPKLRRTPIAASASRSMRSSRGSGCARATSSWRWATRRSQANFVEMRRVTSELADVERALAAAEDAWLDPRGARAVTGDRAGALADGPDRAHRARSAAASRRSPAGSASAARSSSTPTRSRARSRARAAGARRRGRAVRRRRPARRTGGSTARRSARIVFADPGGAPPPRGDRPSRRAAADPRR